MDPHPPSESHAALERLRARRRASQRPAAGQDAPAAETSAQAAADQPAQAAGTAADPAASRTVRPRRALAAPGDLSRRELKQHRRYLSGELMPADTAQTRARRARRRRDLSEVLDSLGSPRLDRLARPLDAAASRLFPTTDPERTEAARERRRAAAQKAEAQAAARREQAHAAAARRAAELAAVEEAAARRETEARHRREAELEALRAAEEQRRQAHQAADQERHAQLMEQARARALEIERLRQAALERQRQAEIDAVLAETTPRPAPEERPRRDLSEVLDSLGSPHLPLEKITAPLAGPIQRLLPQETDPQKLAEAERRRAEAEQKRREDAERRRAEAAETARRRAEEWSRLEAAARAREDEEQAERLAALRARQEDAERRSQARFEAEQTRRQAEEQAARRAAAERAAALERAQRLQQEKEAEAARAAAEEEQRRLEASQEWLEETARLRRAAEVAEQRKAERKRRQEAEAARRRRARQDEKAAAVAEAERRRQQEQARQEREAAAAAERARVQAARRAREEAEAQEREKQRRAEEAERRRQAAAEAERRRREREAAARAAAEAFTALQARRRRWTDAYATAQLARARGWEDRLIAEELRVEAEQAERLRRHQERETRALQAAARRLEGAAVVPGPQERPLLAGMDEDVSDAELEARALAVLPEWRRRDRLANKARAIETAAARPDEQDPAPERAPSAVSPALPYTLPVHEPQGHATARDRGRQLFVTLAAALFVLSGTWGSGLLSLVRIDVPGAGGYLTAHDGLYGMGATVLSPLFLHVLTWPLLFLLAGLYAVHQWGPRQGYAVRQRGTGRQAGAALLCLAAWFPLAVLAPPGLALAAWIGAVAFVVAALRGLNRTTARTGGERLCTDGPVGAFTGFLLALTPTMAAVTLHAWGLRIPGVPPAVWGLLGLLAAVALALRLALTERGRMSVALLFAGTMMWLAVPRLLPGPLGAQQTEMVGLPAIFAAFLLVTAVGARRYRITQAEQALRLR